MDYLNVWKLVVPKNHRSQILIESHEALEAGHVGTDKTYHRAAIQYYWPGMYKDIVAFIRKRLELKRFKKIVFHALNS